MDSNSIDNGDKILLQRGIERLNAANEVMRFLSDYFRDKYHLTPMHQVTPTGEIVSVSPLGEKEKLNGAFLNESDVPESERGITNPPPMRDMPGDVALLHGTTEDN